MSVHALSRVWTDLATEAVGSVACIYTVELVQTDRLPMVCLYKWSLYASLRFWNQFSIGQLGFMYCEVIGARLMICTSF